MEFKKKELIIDGIQYRVRSGYKDRENGLITIILEEVEKNETLV